MDNRAVNRYLRRVRRRVAAPREKRDELLAGLTAEIAERLPENAGYNDVVREFGEPEAAARELESVLSEADVLLHRKRTKRLTVILAVICVVLVLFLAWYICYVVNSTVFLPAVETIVYD